MNKKVSNKAKEENIRVIHQFLIRNNITKYEVEEFIKFIKENADFLRTAVKSLE